MKHNVSGKRLGRDMDYRKALSKNLSTSLVKYGSVTTTLGKAKFVRPFVEKLVTKAKKGDLTAIKAIKKSITEDEMVRKLVSEIAPQFATRKGGYTRIIKLGRRDGDNAPVAKIEWVLPKRKATEAKKSAKKKTEGKVLAKKKVKKDE